MHKLFKMSAHKTGLGDKSVHAIITSPPYWGLRKYAGEQCVSWDEMSFAPMAGLPLLTIPAMTCGLGNEPTAEAYIGHLILVMREMWRVLREDGTCWVNLGDSYAESKDASGLKPKDLYMIPARFALAAQADGWYLRGDIIWAKKNPLPESVTDRPTKAHEYIFLLAKNDRYFYDRMAILQPLKESSIQRISQPNFWQQTGGEKDYGNEVNKNRSMRRTLENFAVSSGISGNSHESDEIGSEVQTSLFDEVLSDGNSDTFSENNRGVTPPRFGGDKAEGYDRSVYSGNEWMPTGGANKRDVWFANEEDNSFVRFCDEQGVDLVALACAYQDAAGNVDDVWLIATKPYKGAHFATYPEDLVEPMVLAATSARGVCPACGAPWARVVEKGGTVYQDGGNRKRADAPGAEVSASSEYRTGTIEGKKTIGWQPTCECNEAETIPATVFDPFSGSGTTGRVANRLGRNYIGGDISSEYLSELAPERLGNIQYEIQF